MVSTSMSLVYDGGTGNFGSNIGNNRGYSPSSAEIQQIEANLSFKINNKILTGTPSYFLRFHFFILLVGYIFLAQFILSLFGLGGFDGVIGLAGFISFFGLSKISKEVLSKAKNKYCIK